MIPIADDRTFAAEGAIDRERQADGEPMHAPAGTPCLIPLDDEVPVVLLNRKMDHPEAIEDSEWPPYARAIARRSAPNTRADRSDGSPGVARIVTCTGYRGRSWVG